MLTYAIVFTYLRVIIYYDNDIMRLTEQLGFIKKTSRVMKFNILFIAISCFIIAQIIKLGSDEVWVKNQDWMKNTIIVSKNLNIKLIRFFKYRAIKNTAIRKVV